MASSGGCIAVLVLDPEQRSATVYRASGDCHIHSGQETVGLGDAMPGFSVTVAEIFT